MAIEPAIASHLEANISYGFIRLLEAVYILEYFIFLVLNTLLSYDDLSVSYLGQG